MAKPGLHLSAACVICGAEYRQARSDQLYCSGTCGVRAWRRRQPPKPKVVREPKPPKVKGPHGLLGIIKVPRQTCRSCGSLFYAPPCKLKIGHGIFCSVPCRVREITKTPHMWNHLSGKRGNGGKRKDLDGRYFRSSWEANWARYLNFLIGLGEVARWEFEVDTFEFPVKRGSKFYTPDFKVFYEDGTFVYHEVKGYMDARSATKLNRMKRYYPQIEVRLIDKKVYSEIASKIGVSLPNWEKSAGRVGKKW